MVTDAALAGSPQWEARDTCYGEVYGSETSSSQSSLTPTDPGTGSDTVHEDDLVEKKCRHHTSREHSLLLL